MTKQEWITQYRDRASMRDSHAFAKILANYCAVNGINYNQREFITALNEMDLWYMYRWTDVHFGVVIVEDKNKNIVGVF